MGDALDSARVGGRHSVERDILLANNEYAYVQDMTKGVVALNVGPSKISLSNTERVVSYSKGTRRFVPLNERVSDREDYGTGVESFVEATSSQYVILENPVENEEKATPQRGPNEIATLQTGKKVVMPGPTTFALWPGQVASVIEGHRLREDEYLVIRAYEPDATIKIADEPETVGVGTELVVRGAQNSFFIPPNGFEVVPRTLETGNFVRKAVKLMDGEYCVLLEPDGEKKYVTGPSMVIPEPNETIQEISGNPVRRAYTMREERGLHLKVTKDFTVTEGPRKTAGEGESGPTTPKEGGDDAYLAGIIGAGDFRIGQELFVEGKDGLFFPNENLEIISEVQPISLAEEEGIYVRSIQTGEIETVQGPKNFLPDPTKEEVITRSLESTVSRLYGITTADRQKAFSVYIPPNHAVMVVSEANREVVQGPQTRILGYSENLEKLALSTETPKTDENLLETVFLQVEGNKVSDRVTVETKDHVMLDVNLSYRLNFEGEGEKWFDVSNYVSLLCDHLGSLVRSAVKRMPLDTFYSDSTEVVRNSVLGVKSGEQERTGRSFGENGMRVYDLEVLNIDVLDEGVQEMLDTAQQTAFQVEMDKRRAEITYDLTRTTSEIKQKTYGLEAATLESRKDLLQREEAVRIAEATLDNQVDQLKIVGKATNAIEAKKIEHAHEELRAQDELKRRKELIEAETAAHEARMKAMSSPELIDVMRRLGDQELVIKTAESLGQLSVLEGKSIGEVIRSFYRGIPFSRDGSLEESLTPAGPRSRTGE